MSFKTADRRRVALFGAIVATFALPLAAAVLGFTACGSEGDKGGVLVQRPGSFEVQLPPGWRVILPDRSDGGNMPLFSAFPQAGTKEAGVVLYQERGPSLEAKAQELAELPTMKLGDFKRESDASREMMITTGIDTFSGNGLDIVLAVLRSPNRPEELWTFQCFTSDLSKSPCEQLVRGFTLLP